MKSKNLIKIKLFFILFLLVVFLYCIFSKFIVNFREGMGITDWINNTGHVQCAICDLLDKPVNIINKYTGDHLRAAWCWEGSPKPCEVTVGTSNNEDQWIIRDAGLGFYSITSVSGTKPLSAVFCWDGKPEDCVPAMWGNSEEQLWRLVSKGQNVFNIISKPYNQYLRTSWCWKGSPNACRITFGVTGGSQSGEDNWIIQPAVKEIEDFEGIYDAGIFGYFIIIKDKENNKFTVWPQTKDSIKEFGQQSSATVNTQGMLMLTWTGAIKNTHAGQRVKDGIKWDGEKNVSWIYKGSPYTKDICAYNFSHIPQGLFLGTTTVMCPEDTPLCQGYIYDVTWGKCKPAPNRA